MEESARSESEKALSRTPRRMSEKLEEMQKNHTCKRVRAHARARACASISHFMEESARSESEKAPLPDGRQWLSGPVLSRASVSVSEKLGEVQ